MLLSAIFYSSNLVLIERNVLPNGDIIFLDFLYSHWHQEIPVYGISNIQVLLYSILYLKSASITFYQISASFAH